MTARPTHALLTALLSLSAAQAATLKLPSDAITVAAGDFLSIPVDLQDAGAAPQALGATLSSSLPAGWSLLSDAQLQGGHALINIFVPDDAVAGDYPVAVQATLAGGATLSGQVTVTVPATPKIEFAPIRETRAPVGIAQVRDVIIHNLGNRTEVLHLFSDGGARFDPPVIEIKPWQDGVAKLRFTMQGGGNAAAYNLRAVSADQLASAQDSLGIYTYESGGVLSKPRLTGRLLLGAQYTHIFGGEDAALLRPFGVTMSGSLDGQLSDFVALNAGVTPQQATVTLTGERWSVGGSVSTPILPPKPDDLLHWYDDLLPLHTSPKTYALAGDYDFGKWQLGTSYFTSGGGRWGVAASLGLPRGLGVSASYSPDLVRASGGWSGTFGAYRVGLNAGIQQQAGELGLRLGQSASYSGSRLLLAENLTWSNQEGINLSLQGSTRATRPFGVSFAGNVGWLGGQVYGGLGLRGNYWLSQNWQLYSSAYLSRESIAPAVGLSGGFPVGRGNLSLGGEVGYATDTRLVGYSLSAAYTTEKFDISSMVVGSGAGLNGYGVSAAYAPNLTWKLRAAFVAQRSTLNPELGLIPTAQVGLTYEGSRIQASAVYRMTKTPDGSLNQAYGGSVRAQLTPRIGVQAGALRSGSQTQLSLGAQVVLGQSFDTPAGLVKLFGGRKVGTLEVLAFVDSNLNGQFDVGERVLGGLPITLGKQNAQTNAQGLATAELLPAAYPVGLGSDVPATLSLCACATPESLNATVQRGKITRVMLPLTEGGAVRGTVLGENGEALSHVTVRLSGPEEQPQTHDVQTDGVGTFSIGALPYGTYTVSVLVDPNIYTAPPAQRVVLSPAEPLGVTNLGLKQTVLENHALDTLDLGIRLELSEQAVPAGISIPVVMHTTAAADSAYLELGGKRVPAQGSGTTWTALLPLPADAKSSLSVRGVAVKGDRQDSVQAIVQIDPNLGVNQLMFGPRHALPGDRLRLRLRTFDSAIPTFSLNGAPARPLTRLLQDGAASEWTLELDAPNQAGPHTGVLMVGNEIIPVLFDVMKIGQP